MTFTELVIVYISCGAPFAVERLLSDGRRSRTSLALASIAHLGFWPAFLLVRLIRVIRSVFVSGNDQKNFGARDEESATTSAAHQNLVILLAGSGAGRSVLPVKELLDRYAGLASLLKLSRAEPLIHDSEIARISNHPSPPVAASCRNRRNVALIRKHLAIARNEFLELLAEALADSPNYDAILSSALDFVGQVDPLAGEHIQKLIATPPRSAMVRSTPTDHIHYEQTNAA